MGTGSSMKRTGRGGGSGGKGGGRSPASRHRFTSPVGRGNGENATGGPIAISISDSLSRGESRGSIPIAKRAGSRGGAFPDSARGRLRGSGGKGGGKNDVAPRMIEITKQIGDCAKAGNVTGAERVFNSMQAEGLEPDVRAYCVTTGRAVWKTDCVIAAVLHASNLNKAQT
ncbi:unnamed protein product [Amoebophrya sp. A120]|nr:unnamed protein product [Amoebophrya sp. A120]|eukprot:GSA120T00022563001.1